MRIYSLLNIGDFHTNQCEDFLVSEELSLNRRLVAVMDGCTMGRESIFASMLIGKILRKIAKDKFYKNFKEEKELELVDSLKEITKELFQEIRSTKNQLALETNELLSTLIIGIINEDLSIAEFLTIGDGLIYHDGKIEEYEQNDKPDYLGYHLHEDFDSWYKTQKQRLSISFFKDLSICTDGIFSFKNLENKNNQRPESEIIEFLLRNSQGSDINNFMEEKLRFIKENWKHVVTDDLAIIRIITSADR
jgi:serine/threonine protein phosphatase PrpC